MARCSYVNTVCRELSKLKFQQLFESSQDTVKDHSIETNRRLRRVCIRSFRKGTGVQYGADCVICTKK